MLTSLDSAHTVTPGRLVNFAVFLLAAIGFLVALFRLGPSAGKPWLAVTMTLVLACIAVEMLYEHWQAKESTSDEPAGKPKGFTVLPPKDPK